MCLKFIYSLKPLYPLGILGTPVKQLSKWCTIIKPPWKEYLYQGLKGVHDDGDNEKTENSQHVRGQ